MGRPLFAIGMDFGTNSVRAILLELESGTEITSATVPYPSGDQGIFLDNQDPHLARQYPGDYDHALDRVIHQLLSDSDQKQIDRSNIGGIGVDSTASTPLPIQKNGRPLALNPDFEDNLNAYAWLWKDHTAANEAREITDLARDLHPEYIAKCGGSYSSEWFFSKIYHCLNVDPAVFEAAYTWIELSDYIPALLSGVDDADQITHNVCAAGHKAMYSEEWGGLPDRDFWEALDEYMAALQDQLYDKAYSIEHPAGYLDESWASKWGLEAGIPIAAGMIDAHAGAIGTGVGKGTLAKVIGTSTCDIMVQPPEDIKEDIPGIAGIVYESVLPGYTGLEAGQAAVGDLLNWFISDVLREEEEAHRRLSDEASKQRAGEHGLLALDWNNGNRNILADPDLSGLVLGQTLQTKDYEIYRALIDATGFGALMIIDQMEEYGITVDKIVSCGGITQKNPFFMQTYADILNRPIEVAENQETVALGAAIIGGYIARKESGEAESIEEIQQTVCSTQPEPYQPRPEENEHYQELYELYKKVHDAFGREDQQANLGKVMKQLKSLKERM